MKNKLFVVLLILIFVFSSFTVSYASTFSLAPAFIAGFASLANPLGTALSVLGGVAVGVGFGMASAEIVEQIVRYMSTQDSLTTTQVNNIISTNRVKYGDVFLLTESLLDNVQYGVVDVSSAGCTIPLVGWENLVVGADNDYTVYFESDILSNFTKTLTIDSTLYNVLFATINRNAGYIRYILYNRISHTIESYVFNGSTYSVHQVLFSDLAGLVLTPFVVDNNLTTASGTLSMGLTILTDEYYNTYSTAIGYTDISWLGALGFDITDYNVNVNAKSISLDSSVANSLSATSDIAIDTTLTNSADFADSPSIPILGGILDWLRKIWERLGNILQSIIDYLTDVIDSITNGFNRLISKIENLFNDGFSNFSNYLSHFLQIITGYSLFSGLFGHYLPNDFVVVITLFIDILVLSYIFRFVLNR